MNQAQRPVAEWLRLDRDHTRAKAAEAGDPVADMGANVEGQIARAQEPGMQAVHGQLTGAITMIDTQRAEHALQSLGTHAGLQPPPG